MHLFNCTLAFRYCNGPFVILVHHVLDVLVVCDFIIFFFFFLEHPHINSVTTREFGLINTVTLELLKPHSNRLSMYCIAQIFT